VKRCLWITPETGFLILTEETGNKKWPKFFVAVLWSSGLTYAEVSRSQKKEDFIRSVEHSSKYFGGVKKAVVPDNLRSAMLTKMMLKKLGLKRLCLVAEIVMIMRRQNFLGNPKTGISVSPSFQNKN